MKKYIYEQFNRVFHYKLWESQIILSVSSKCSDCETPDRTGGVLHPPEDVVETEIVPHSVLPAVGIVTVKCKSICKPK